MENIPKPSVEKPTDTTLNFINIPVILLPNLKIDDKDFDASNPGVWVHRVHDLKTKEVFTDWSKYTTDEIIG